MAKKVIKLEAQLKAKSLAGENTDEISSLAEKVLSVLLKIINGKTKCLNNMRKVSNEKQ